MTARAWSLFLAVSALSGSAYLFIKVAVEALPALVVVEGRLVVGAAVLLPIALHRQALRGLRGRLRSLTVLAVLGFAGPFLLVTAGSAYIPSSLTGVLMAAGPIFVAVLAWWFDAAERVRGRRLVGLAVGMAGVVSLLGFEVSARPSALLGATLVLGASLSFAGGALYVRSRFADDPPLGVVAASLGISAVLVAGPAALAAPAARPTTSAVLTVALLGLVYAAGNYVLYVLLVQTVGAGRAAVTSYVAPAIAVVLGIVILGEPARAGLVAGLLLVLAGSWLATGGGLPPGLAPLRRPGGYWSAPPWRRRADGRARLAVPPPVEPFWP